VEPRNDLGLMAQQLSSAFVRWLGCKDNTLEGIRVLSHLHLDGVDQEIRAAVKQILDPTRGALNPDEIVRLGTLVARCETLFGKATCWAGILHPASKLCEVVLLSFVNYALALQEQRQPNLDAEDDDDAKPVELPPTSDEIESASNSAKNAHRRWICLTDDERRATRAAMPSTPSIRPARAT
jgi:hypothetical protein